MTERGKNDDGGGEIGGTPGGGEERTEADGGKGGRGEKPVETKDGAEDEGRVGTGEEEGAEADGGRGEGTLAAQKEEIKIDGKQIIMNKLITLSNQLRQKRLAVK